jgi:hypothetical protein
MKIETLKMKFQKIENFVGIDDSTGETNKIKS